MKLVVHPYKSPRKIWAFDHEHNNTKGEALLNGTENVIDIYYENLTGGKPTPGCKMKFTLDTEPFPGATTKLTLEETDTDGSTYVDELTEMEVWLCPWLQGYFGDVPQVIYILPETLA